MEYRCVDVGSDKCPCILMESGQCYTCTMARTGRCHCGLAWQGSCPYTEYVQGRRGYVHRFVCRIKEIKEYSKNLKVLSLYVPAGLCLKASQPGTFMMVKSKEWNVPLSVLRCNIDEGQGIMEFAVNPIGPKTKSLFDSNITRIEIRGPFYSGLIGYREGDMEKDAVVIGKGLAFMPFIHLRNNFSGSKTLLLQKDKLNASFFRDYMESEKILNINLDEEASLNEIKDITKKVAKNSRQRLWLLVSPYYSNKILDGLSELDRDKIIRPNHANMCCGEGICGSCSYTDRDGVTVRLCKCKGT